MKELYLDYIQERLGKEILVEPGKAFIIYEIQGEEIYIQDIYVDPLYRKTGLMAEMEKKIEALAIQRGCRYATGSVQPSANNSTQGLEYCLKRGYKLLETGNNYIILKKELME